MNNLALLNEFGFPKETLV